MAALIGFPLWLLLALGAAVVFTDQLKEMKSWILPLLMWVMLMMGMTLRWQNFAAVWRRKILVFYGVLLQFVFMPLFAWLLATWLQLPLEWMIGMILVGVTAGGTASNVVAYLAKGDLALSVSMTLVSTLLATALMPLLTWVYLQQSIEVPVLSMLWTLGKLILFPLILGMLIAHFFEKAIERSSHLLPHLAQFAIAFIIGIIVALNLPNLHTIGSALILAIVLHNLLGLMAGYFGTRLMGYDSVLARTVAIEVAMQNSGLSVALAIKYFSPMAALPGALFSIWHNLSGMAFAAYWRLRENSGGKARR
ncbi:MULTISPECIES: bile acid:sodium symporter family protein [Thiomicrorhabdus]|uniref:Bile acid:sodium symporter family protein n=1 Tax=Thiomicrorhabdus heinhorstiae TaxID=2748010 RepID=A0ABS0BVS4_9GAMM|nr:MULTISPECIES: bile acid:sodium symporter family protein [Thiomicrorhabdus]MBF6057927.1 bile acid:sodium symporter family protein [Thiomicrorhabdus heinhorstiae]